MRAFPTNYLIVLLFFFAEVNAFAQAPTKVDSLWSAYEQSEDIEQRIDALKGLGSLYLYNDVDSAVIILDELKTLAVKYDDSKALINYYQNTALVHHRQTNNELALTYIDTAIQLCRQTGDSLKVASNLINKGAIYQQMGKSQEAIKVQYAIIQMMAGREDGNKILAKALHNTGVNYSDLGLQTEALSYLFRALDIKRKDKDPISLLSTYSTIASIYQERENYSKALAYYEESIPWAEASESQYHQSVLKINMATNYIELGDMERADQLLAEAEAISKGINSAFLLMHTQLNQADLAIRRKKYTKATRLLIRCQQFSKEQQLPYGQVNALISLAEVEKATKRYKSGIQYLRQALNILNDYQNPELESQVQKLLGTLYEKMGDYRQSLISYQKYQSYQDSVYNAENSKIVAGMQMQYEFELAEKDFQLRLSEKESSLETAQTRAQRWYLLTIGLVALLLLVIVVLLFLNSKRQKDSKEELAQMNKELYDANENLEIAYLDLASSNQKLNQAHNKLQEFSFSAYHDFKESLRNIITYSQLLVKKHLKDGGLHREDQAYISQIVKNSTGMSKLLDNLQTFNNDKDQVKEELDFTLIMEHIKDTWRKDKGPVPLDIAFSFEGTPPKIVANSSQINQIFSNLIENAVKFKRTDVPLTVEVGTKQRNRQLIFFVRDNGRGIDEAYHDRIFDPFFRLHGRNISGSGMGLAVVRRIVESYDGKIWLESSEGSGTTIYLTLPAAVHTAQHEGIIKGNQN